MHDFSPEPQQQLNNNIDFDRSMDSVNIIENRIVALISSLIDFNPNYFEDAENLNKLHKLTNMLDSNEKAVFFSIPYFFFLNFIVSSLFRISFFSPYFYFDNLNNSLTTN